MGDPRVLALSELRCTHVRGACFDGREQVHLVTGMAVASLAE
jgi:hypothetical protein